MNHHSTDLKQKAKVQRLGNRYKTSQKVDQHKIDEILGQELPGTPPHINPSSDLENPQSVKPAQYGSLQGSSAIPGSNKYNKNQKLPVLPPLGQSKKQDYGIQKQSQQYSQQPHQNISNDTNMHYLNKRRGSDSSNHSSKNSNNVSNIPRPSFELPKLPKKVDKFAISADLSDLENSESCSSAPEEFKKTLPKKISKSNSIDNFNMTSTTIIEDFFQSSDESEYDADENPSKNQNDDDDFIGDDDFSFDEIISDSDNESEKSDKKVKKNHLLTSQELQLCKDTSSIYNEAKQRIDKLLKIARNHFPATKDNTAMLTRLVEQSRACHEFHFLEKRTKYYESENRGLTIALTSLEDIISNPQSINGNNINNKVKFGLQRLNALQMRQAKRMSKELSQAQRKIKKLRAEISKLHTEMRASVKARRGGDGSLLIAEMNNINNGNNNNNNVANFGGGNGADDDELAALKVEHQFSIAKEKAAVGVMQKENEELERIINTYEKRILLMTQKESNYSRLFKKKPPNSNEKSPPKVVNNPNEKSPQKVHSNVKSSLKSKPNQKNENKKETSPNKSGISNKNQKSQKNDQKHKQQNQNEEQKLQQAKKEPPVKKSSTKVASPKNKKESDDDEVPIIEVLSI